MKTIALNRLNVLGIARGEGLTAEQQITFLAELSKLGYRVTNPSILNEVSQSFLLDYKHWLKALATKRGGDVQYVPLFKTFPESTPDDQAYFAKRLMGYMGNIFGLFPDAVTLDNSVKVPKWLFDIYQFGADPITQMQSKELFDLAVRENRKKKNDTHVEWMDLTIVHNAELQERLKVYMTQLLYAKSSIKEALHKDLYALLDFFGANSLDGDLIVFKENKSLLMQYLWKKEAWDTIATFAKTATDILRLFAAVTDSDVSLNEKIKFPKLSRRVRRMVLTVLERSSSLPEDLKKYKGLWLEIGRYLHPSEYAKQYPRTASLFDALRNGKIETYNAKTEKLLAVKELYELLEHLESKPGVYARKLHEVLRIFPSATAQVLESFERNINKVALKNLLVLKAYFSSINTAEYRTIINKKGKMKVLPNNALAALSEKSVDKVVWILEAAIRAQVAEKESWETQKAWVDPALMHYTIPLQQRKASDGILTVGRGSQIKVDFSKVLRLFIYWKEATQRTDLDLSIIQFSKDFKYLGHVSYTNIKADGITYSGDIQSAPMGAAEFMDITLSKLKKEVKYLAVQVNKYCGDNFVDMDCHAGWMLREEATSDVKTFDIKTVVNKFDLNGIGGYAIPLMVDVEARKVISTDLYVSGINFHNNVEGSTNDVALLCSQLAQFVKTRPVLSDLAYAHVVARNAQLVIDKSEADITFGLRDCTYNATDVEEILTELI